MTWVNDTDGGAEIRVHVQPGARRSEVRGFHDDALKIAVREKATDGAANRAVCSLLSALLGVAKSDVEILSGHRSRRKRVRVAGMKGHEIATRVASLPSG